MSRSKPVKSTAKPAGKASTLKKSSASKTNVAASAAPTSPAAVKIMSRADKQKFIEIAKAASEILARRTEVVAELNALGKASHAFLAKHGFVGAGVNANHECVSDLDKIDLKKIALWDDDKVVEVKAPRKTASAKSAVAKKKPTVAPAAKVADATKVEITHKVSDSDGGNTD